MEIIPSKASVRPLKQGSEGNMNVKEKSHNWQNKRDNL